MTIRHGNYKHLFLPTICMLVVSLVGLISCEATIQTPTPDTEPTPEAMTPGTGAATGQVMFTDGMPAHRNIVYVFKEGETKSYASCYVDKDGYYVFPNLPVGRYEIYTASYATVSVFMGAPEAVITVSEYETTTVPTLTVLRYIEIACQEEYLTTTQPKFSWEAVPNARYYLVKVRSITEGYGDYAKEVQVLDTQVTWSALSLGHYRVDVDAYNEHDSLMGSGCDWFWIGRRPPLEP